GAATLDGAAGDAGVDAAGDGRAGDGGLAPAAGPVPGGGRAPDAGGDGTSGSEGDAARSSARMADEPRWRWPVEGRVAEPFGWRLDEGDAPRFHEGIDIAARAGTAVRAAADGVVVRVWYDRAGLGWLVEVDHGGGWVTRYAVVDHVVVR